jgi:hypothetical protein
MSAAPPVVIAAEDPDNSRGSLEESLFEFSDDGAPLFPSSEHKLMIIGRPSAGLVRRRGRGLRHASDAAKARALIP